MASKKQVCKNTNYTFVLKGINTTNVDRRFGITIASNIEDTDCPNVENTTDITELLEQPVHQVASTFMDDSKNYSVSMVDAIVDSQLSNNLCCFWCRNYFPSTAIGCPLQYKPKRMYKQFVSEITSDVYTVSEHVTNTIDQSSHTEEGHYETEGVFCSFNCCMAYILDNQHNSKYKHSKNLLYNLHRSLFPAQKFHIIKPAPSWKLLREYGGTLTIDEFRKSFGQYVYVEKEYNIKHMPRIRPIGSIFEQQYLF